MDQDTIARSPRKVLESLLLLSLYCRRPQYWCTFCLGSTPALSTAAAINAHGHADPPPHDPPHRRRNQRPRGSPILPTAAAINGMEGPPLPWQASLGTSGRRHDVHGRSAISSSARGKNHLRVPHHPELAQRGHLTCPVTNLPLLPSPPLIPNHALRRLIAVVSPSVTASLVPAEGGAHTRQEAVSAAVPTRPASPVLALLRPQGGGRCWCRATRRCCCDKQRPGTRRRPGRCCTSAWTATTHTWASWRTAPWTCCPPWCPTAAASAATTLTSLDTVDMNKCTIRAHPSAIPALAGLLRRVRAAGGP
jgi:hypothetical protein